ncbi:Very-long-chain (3R)-3-hydroxyacyl-CoA dehydratase PASTICCINO 2A [Hordeum vulgare]|nr:Very-long-chain (3R)-3-hydroxyacyl-CoA dehydratase PASTICCINO 2A [Hordeum vulgare]
MRGVGLKILHRRLGLVRSLVLATMLQIGSHLFVTWSFPEVPDQDTHRGDLVSSLVIIWSITEDDLKHPKEVEDMTGEGNKKLRLSLMLCCALVGP